MPLAIVAVCEAGSRVSLGLAEAAAQRAMDAASQVLSPKLIKRLPVFIVANKTDSQPDGAKAIPVAGVCKRLNNAAYFEMSLKRQQGTSAVFLAIQAAVLKFSADSWVQFAIATEAHYATLHQRLTDVASEGDRAHRKTSADTGMGRGNSETSSNASLPETTLGLGSGVRVRIMASFRNLLVTGDDDGVVRLYIIRDTGHELLQTFSLYDGGPISALVVMECSRRPTGDPHEVVRRRDTEEPADPAEGEEGSALEFELIRGEHREVLHNIYIAGGEVSGQIALWCATTGQCRRIMRGHKKAITKLLLLGDTLLSSSLDGDVRVWTPLSGANAVYVFEGTGGPMTHMQLVSNRWLFTTGPLATSGVYQWDLTEVLDRIGKIGRARADVGALSKRIAPLCLQVPQRFGEGVSPVEATLLLETAGLKELIRERVTQLSTELSLVLGKKEYDEQLKNSSVVQLCRYYEAFRSLDENKDGRVTHHDLTMISNARATEWATLVEDVRRGQSVELRLFLSHYAKLGDEAQKMGEFLSAGDDAFLMPGPDEAPMSPRSQGSRKSDGTAVSEERRFFSMSRPRRRSVSSLGPRGQAPRLSLSSLGPRGPKPLASPRASSNWKETSDIPPAWA